MHDWLTNNSLSGLMNKRIGPAVACPQENG